MAAAPYLIVSPLSFMSLVGLIGDRPAPPPANLEDVKDLTVDAFVPAHNESKNIAFALASLARQTKKPGKVFVVDDASADDTKDVVEAFSALHEIDIILVERKERQGKVPALEQIARFSDADVLFVLDGDTVLESQDYIEVTMAELFRTQTNASASGYIAPLTNHDRQEASEWHPVKKMVKARPDTRLYNDDGAISKASRGITNFYRDVLYYFDQHIISLGEFSLFGTLVNPPGCAVAYRRDRLVDLFKTSKPVGDDARSIPEDFFIEFGFVERGLHNVQVLSVRALSHEREGNRLLKQLYLWSKRWLQSSYFFPQLVSVPFKAMRRRRKGLSRNILDEPVYVPYQKPLGRLAAGDSRRKVGWTVLIALIEKISYPLILLVMLAEKGWFVFLMIVFWESILYAIVTGIYGRKERAIYILRGFLVTPLRYLSIFMDVFVVGKFLSELARSRQATKPS